MQVLLVTRDTQFVKNQELAEHGRRQSKKKKKNSVHRTTPG